MAVAQAAKDHRVECKIDVMGERPAGKTPVNMPIVEAALEATRQLGTEPQLDVGSTDANVPMSLGIPAIAIGAGGSCGNVHTAEEWFDTTSRHLGLQRLLTLIAVLAGLE
jgi:di/tripeptidase